MPQKRVLIIFYSLSSQTRNLIRALVSGLEEQGVEVTRESLQPVKPIHFPLGGYYKTVKMMVLTCFRMRLAIEPLNDVCNQDYDLVIVAGPTWSYNPSSPVLSFLDRDGKQVLAGRLVLPLISCRGYYRFHAWGLKRLLKKCGAKVLSPFVVTHTTEEPWRTIGVFLKLAGKVPEAGKSWIHHYYPKYGHSRAQIQDVKKIGKEIGSALSGDEDLSTLSFPLPLPFKKTK